MRVDVASLLRAHSFMRTEAPPEPWTPDVDDEDLVRLLGEMIAAALACGTALPDLTFAIANVVAEDDEDPDATAPTGEFVAVSVTGAGERLPERTWRPGGGTPEDPFVSADLETAAERAGAVFGYSRHIDGVGTVVVWFRRDR